MYDPLLASFSRYAVIASLAGGGSCSLAGALITKS